MFGLIPGSDFSFLIGHQVNQVCFGEYQTQIQLLPASISFECKHVLTISKDNRVIVTEGEAPPNTNLVCLLGSTLTAAQVVEEDVLQLIFSNGDRLTLFDDSPQFESFQIQCGDIFIVV